MTKDELAAIGVTNESELEAAVAAGSLTVWRDHETHELISVATPGWPAIEKALVFKEVQIEVSGAKAAPVLVGSYVQSNGEDCAYGSFIGPSWEAARARVIEVLRLDYAFKLRDASAKEAAH